MDVEFLIRRTQRLEGILNGMFRFQIRTLREICREYLRDNIYCSGQTYAYVRDKRLGRGEISTKYCYQRSQRGLREKLFL